MVKISPGVRRLRPAIHRPSERTTRPSRQADRPRGPVAQRSGRSAIAVSAHSQISSPAEASAIEQAGVAFDCSWSARQRRDGGEPAAPFSGRDAQMAAVSEQLDRACSGIGTGDPGRGRRDAENPTARPGGDSGATPRFRVGTYTADPSDGMAELATLMAALFDGYDPILHRAEFPELRSAKLMILD